MVRKHLGSGLRHVLVAECAVHTPEAWRRHADASHHVTERSPRYDIDSGVQALEDCLLLKRCKVRNMLKVSVLKAVNQGDGLQDLQAFMRRNRTKAQIGAGTKMEFSMGRLGTEMTRCQGHRLTLLTFNSTDSMLFVKATIADLVLKEKRTPCLTRHRWYPFILSCMLSGDVSVQASFEADAGLVTSAITASRYVKIQLEASMWQRQSIVRH